MQTRALHITIALAAVIVTAFSPGRLIAQDLQLEPEIFADREQISLYRVNYTYDVQADSVTLESLPYKVLILEVYAVIDTTIEQLDSARLSLRDGQGDLFTLLPPAEGGAIDAGAILSSRPMRSTGTTGDTLVLHLHTSADITGHLRLFVVWRRLY